MLRCFFLFLSLSLATGCMKRGDDLGPVGAFNRGFPCGQVVEEEIKPHTHDGEDRIYHNITFDAEQAGQARFALSLPEKVPNEGLPCVIVLSGLETGKNGLDVIPEHGNYAIIAYEYPEKLKNWKHFNVIFRVPSTRRSVLSVPAQINTIARWAREQPWSNGEPVNIIGVSIGAPFACVTYHQACRQRCDLGPGVLAYGGTGIYGTAYRSLSGPIIFRAPLAVLAAIIFNQLEPGYHAQFMEGEFLIVNGLCDKRISSHSRERLQCLVPEPKTIRNLNTEHITSENKEIVNQLFRISKDWLETREKRPSPYAHF